MCIASPASSRIRERHVNSQLRRLRARRYGEARAHYESALAIFREIGRTEAIAGLLHNLGTTAFLAGDPDAARGHLEESLRLQQTAGGRAIERLTHLSLGDIARAQGEAARAASGTGIDDCAQPRGVPQPG